MTLEQKITEYFEANEIKKDSKDYRLLYKDVTTGEGLPQEVLDGRFLFTHEGKKYYQIHPKLEKFLLKCIEERKIK